MNIMIIIFWEMTPCGSHLPEDDNHHSHRRGNLKSYIMNISSEVFMAVIDQIVILRVMIRILL
jgi:hypothetical protein